MVKLNDSETIIFLYLLINKSTKRRTMVLVLISHFGPGVYVNDHHQLNLRILAVFLVLVSFKSHEAVALTY